jgi:HAD superfamily hydrolase (TIGR01450 family)
MGVISLQEALLLKKLYLLDMDGTLYLGNRLFGHSPDFLRRIRALGARPLYLTNNSSRSTGAYVDKLARFGIASQADDFFTSTDAAIAYLKANWKGTGIYALGTASFREQLRLAGFPVYEDVTDAVDLLLLGYDTELTYGKLVDACVLLGRGVTYLATNMDWVCPTEFGFVPDCGAIAQALEHATGRLPHFLGKPEPDIARLAMAKCGATPAETVLIGDRIYTDIACGKNAGVTSILVFSGETAREDLEKSDVKPDYTAEDIGEVLDAMR